MRIAVLGANGFIGRHVCDRVLASGHELVGISRSRPTGVVPARTVGIDTSDVTKVTTALEGCNVVLHVAGAAHLSGGTPTKRAVELTNGNPVLTRVVAQAARDAGVGRVIHLSSAGVLGRDSRRGPFHDTSVPAPYDEYTASKVAAEQVLEQVLSGSNTRFVSVRPPMVYGPDAPGNFGRMVALLRTGLPLPFGACEARRAVIGVRNLSDFLLFMAETDAALPRTVLCRDRELLTVSEFVLAVASRISSRSRIFSVPPSLLRTVLVACGRVDDWRRLFLPFELNTTRGSDRLGWRAPFHASDELDWSLVT